MQKKSRVIAILVTAAMLATHSSSASAAPQAACSLLTLPEVRAIVGSPVVIFQASSQAPTVRGDHTDSGCVYMPPGSAKDWKGAGSGFFHLTWGPAATLTTGYNTYMQRHWTARIKGGVLASAMVSNGKTIDVAASNKLLDAVLKKL